ncbi:MAG: ankyrin repeat domain-containing protein, partial [Acidobacteriota bacterium]
MAPSGWTPLAAAIRGEYTYGGRGDRAGTVRWLLDRGAGIDEVSHDRSPLMQAVERGDAELVEELIRRGADLEAQNSAGWAALHLAAASGHNNERRIQPVRRGDDPMAPVVEILLRAGARPDQSGLVLRLAVANRCPEVVRRLVREGAPVDAADAKWNVTPLMCAVGSPKILRHLLRHGADPNRADANGETALHYAVHRWIPCEEALTILAGAGARLNVRGRAGETPLAVAVTTGVESNVATLLRLGADPLQANDQGRTPLDAAKDQSNTALVALLVEAVEKRKTD